MAGEQTSKQGRRGVVCNSKAGQSKAGQSKVALTLDVHRGQQFCMGGNSSRLFNDLNKPKRVIYRKATIRKATIRKATIRKATIRKVTIRKATIRKATIRKATIRKATIRKATIRKATIRKATIRKATIRKATVRGFLISQPGIQAPDFSREINQNATKHVAQRVTAPATGIILKT